MRTGLCERGGHKKLANMAGGLVKTASLDVLMRYNLDRSHIVCFEK